MKVLVIGRSGQLATELRRAPWPEGTVVDCRGRGEIDILDPGACDAAVAATAPTLLVNAAAYTAVDRAESERDAAFALNGLAVRHIAAAAQRQAVPVIHISTDYVFDGSGHRPWRELDPTNPLGVYGQSKLAGERALEETHAHHVILRTSWIFASHGQNFVRTMLRLGGERTTLSIVNDQIGCPTPAADLARVVAAIGTALAAGEPCFGLYHYAGSGAVSWFDFARAIFDEAGDLVERTPALLPITTAQFGAPAPRPAYSVLDSRRIERQFGLAAAPWAVGLRAVLDEIRRERRGDLATSGGGPA